MHGVGAAEDGEAAAGDAGLGSRLRYLDPPESIRGTIEGKAEGALPSVAASLQICPCFKKPPARAGSYGDVPSSPVSPSAAKPDTADTNDTSTNKATGRDGRDHLRWRVLGE